VELAVEVLVVPTEIRHSQLRPKATGGEGEGEEKHSDKI